MNNGKLIKMNQFYRSFYSQCNWIFIFNCCCCNCNCNSNRISFFPSKHFSSGGLILTFKWNSQNLSKVFWPVTTSWALVTTIHSTYHEQYRLQKNCLSHLFFLLLYFQANFVPIYHSFSFSVDRKVFSSVLDQFQFVLCKDFLFETPFISRSKSVLFLVKH